MTRLTCPACGIVVDLVAAVQPRGAHATYDAAKWAQACRAGAFCSPLVCPFLRPTIEALASERPAATPREDG